MRYLRPTHTMGHRDFRAIFSAGWLVDAYNDGGKVRTKLAAAEGLSLLATLEFGCFRDNFIITAIF